MRARSVLSAAVLGAVLIASPASAHTESDVVAVPAGSPATVTFKPTHGCNGSPTIQIDIQAPVAEAKAGNVPGWTAKSHDDGAGNTVLTWSEGSLPDAQEGAFPINFTAPDKAGEVLLFKAVQTCENGEQESWISGDPNGDNPAPRLLILPADMEAAHSIDEVPADAPGRDKLNAVIESVDPAEATTTTAAATETSSDIAPIETAEPGSVTEDTSNDATDAPADDADETKGDMPWVAIIGAIVLAALIAGGAIAMRAKKQAEADPADKPNDTDL